MYDQTETNQLRRLRRLAAKQGLKIHKQRKIAPYTERYGRYLITDAELSNCIVSGANSMDGIEKWLNEPQSVCA